MASARVCMPRGSRGEQPQRSPVGAVIGWLDCSSGVAGDMLLAALVDAGVPLDTMQHAVDAIAPEPVSLRVEEVRRAALRATQVQVDAVESTTPRTWAQIRDLLDDNLLSADVATRARGAFERLATAEARVHGGRPEDVHFHEVGALDAIADVVGTAAGFAALNLAELHVSPVALGSGTVSTAHGRLPCQPRPSSNC